MALAASAAAQTSAATKTFANEQYHYAVALPAGCRHEEGPGTVDAVCAADFDPERSAQVSSATALVMEVGAEIVAGDAGRTASDLAQRYDEAAFRQEVPQAICGESDASRARINNVKQTLEDTRVAYTADVICAEVQVPPDRRTAGIGAVSDRSRGALPRWSLAHRSKISRGISRRSKLSLRAFACCQRGSRTNESSRHRLSRLQLRSRCESRTGEGDGRHGEHGLARRLRQCLRPT